MITDDEVLRLFERADPARTGDAAPAVDAAGYLETLRTRSSTVAYIDTEPTPTEHQGNRRMGRLPEAWIAPPVIRELRELVRYRAKLVQLRSGLEAQVHAVMAKEGVLPTVADKFCGAGQVHVVLTSW